jgi:hypothetical protein
MLRGFTARIEAREASDQLAIPFAAGLPASAVMVGHADRQITGQLV